MQQDTSSEDTDNNHSDSEDDTLSVITKTFEDEQELEINKINNGNKSTMRNYYSRPSPPDLQYEERGTFSMNQFDGQSVYTWNIDGKSEHEILNTLQEMTMACICLLYTSPSPRD